MKYKFYIYIVSMSEQYMYVLAYREEAFCAQKISFGTVLCKTSAT